LVVAKNTNNNRADASLVTVHASGAEVNSISEKKSRGSILKTGLMTPKDMPGY